MEGFWQFLEVAPRKWVWECRNADGSNTRMGPFGSLADCIKDAKNNGFDESMRDRRRVPRRPPKQT